MAGEQDEQKGPNWRALEKSRDDALAQAQQWKNVALQGLVQAGGFNPKDPIVGLLVNQFNTDDLDPATLDANAFVKFAKDYNVEPKPVVPEGQPDPNVQAQVDQLQAQQTGQPGQPVPQGQPAPTPQPPVPAQGFMQQFQAPADALLQSAAGTPPPSPSTPQAQIAQAEQAGNWDASFAGKFDLTRSIYNNTPQPSPHAGPVNDQGLPVRTPGA